jgi:hypothetical protein
MLQIICSTYILFALHVLEFIDQIHLRPAFIIARELESPRRLDFLATEQLQQLLILSCHCYFFFAKQKKPSQTVPHLRLPFTPSWEKLTPRAHICAQRFATHPPVL